MHARHAPPRAVLGWIARLAVSVVLVAIVAVRVDVSEVTDRLGRADPLWLAGAVCALITAHVIGWLRWHRLLAAAGCATRPRRSLRAFLLGMLGNATLPTSVGGDVVRAWAVVEHAAAVPRAVGSILVDRIAGVTGMVFVAGTAALAAPGLPGRLTALVAWLLAAWVAGALVLLLLVGRRKASLTPRLPARVQPAVNSLRDALRLLLRRPRVSLEAIVLSVALQVLLAVEALAGARAIGIGDVGVAELSVVVSLVLVLTLVPISIAGFGVREGGFVLLLEPLGVHPAEATVLSLLLGAGLLLLALPGTVMLITTRRNVRASTPPDT